MPNSKRRRAKPLKLRDSADESWNYEIEEKLNDPRFTADPSLIDRLEGKDVTSMFAQSSGFKKPILIEQPDGLGIKVPPISFSVRDASSYVGADRILDVMDVETQTGERMAIKEFVKYFETPADQRSRLLNVLSLEFSNTPLADLVSAPDFVRQLDWIDCVWPPQYKSQQAEGTNAMSKMMYPKVQKYLIMSVEKCYTDFHIDFGGTSVWYNVMTGEKIFWLIPPTDQNLMRFQEWTLSGQQNNVFFGDLVSEIYQITLRAPNTFLIPSGWIHAVYTPKDTLVMGGNFLHSLNIPMQLYVFEIENNTQVPEMLRFPYYVNIQWFAAERYVHELSGKSFLNKKLRDPVSTSEPVPFKPITQFELDGLCVLLDWLSVNLNDKVITAPKEIVNPKGLLEELKNVLRQHSTAEHELAVTGVPLLTPLTMSSVTHISELKTPQPIVAAPEVPTRTKIKRDLQIADIVSEIASSVAPEPLSKRLKEEPTPDTSLAQTSFTGLMETMANCLKTVGNSLSTPPVSSSLSTIVSSSDVPCSTRQETFSPESGRGKTHKVLSGWCVKSSTVENSGQIYGDEIPATPVPDGHSVNTSSVGKEGRFQTTIVSKVHHSASATISPAVAVSGLQNNSGDSVRSRPVILVPSEFNADWIKKILDSATFRRRGNSPPALTSVLQEAASSLSDPLQTSHDLEAMEVHQVKQEPPEPPEVIDLNVHLESRKKAWLAVFVRLPRKSLCSCMLVCQRFHDWALTSELWETIKLARAQLTSSHFTGLIKRQPVNLNLGWTYLPGKQLNFLLSRLEKLQRLSLPGNNWDTISTLKQLPHRSHIRFLDLRWAELGYTEEDTKELLSSLRQIEELWLSGCQINESGVRYIANQFGHLHTLDLSYCGEVSDLAVELLCAAGTKTRTRLKRLSLAGCEKLTDKIFPSLRKLEGLTSVDLSYCLGLSSGNIEEFANSISVTNSGLVKMING